MKKKILFIYLPLLSIVFSCSSAKTIQSNLDSYKHTLAYLRTSKISNAKRDFAVSIDSVSLKEGIIAKNSKVVKQKGWFIPLVFFYFWKASNECTQGKSMMEEELPLFLRETIAEEINRSGNFNLDTLSKSDYNLELSIEEIGSNGPYECSGYCYVILYYYGFGFFDKAGPALSGLRVSFKLRKGDEVVHSNSFYTEKPTEQMNKKYLNATELQQAYAVAMVEATSHNFRKITELIVKDINDYFSELEG